MKIRAMVATEDHLYLRCSWHVDGDYRADVLAEAHETDGAEERAVDSGCDHRDREDADWQAKELLRMLELVENWQHHRLALKFHDF